MFLQWWGGVRVMVNNLTRTRRSGGKVVLKKKSHWMDKLWYPPWKPRPLLQDLEIHQNLENLPKGNYIQAFDN